jgi:hypothetical protein
MRQGKIITFGGGESGIYHIYAGVGGDFVSRDHRVKQCLCRRHVPERSIVLHHYCHGLCVFVCVCLCVCVCVCVCMYTYICIYINNVHIYVYIYDTSVFKSLPLSLALY